MDMVKNILIELYLFVKFHKNLKFIENTIVIDKNRHPFKNTFNAHMCTNDGLDNIVINFYLFTLVKIFFLYVFYCEN